MKKDTGIQFAVKNFTSWKRVLSNIAIYGCYDEQVSIQNLGISARSYQKTIQRLKKTLKGSFLQSYYNKDKKKIWSFQRKQYQAREPFLIDAYRTKSFTKNDIVYHFFILQILQSAVDEETGVSFRDVWDTIDDVQQQDASFRSTLQRKFDELIELGFIKRTGDETDAKEDWCYTIADDLLEELRKRKQSVEAAEELNRALHFYKNTLPFSVLAQFAQETLWEHLEMVEEIVPEQQAVCCYKNVFLHHVLNEEVAFEIMLAIEQSNLLSVVYKPNDIKIKLQVVPFRIIVDRQYGRQLLFCCIKKSEGQQWPVGRLAAFELIDLYDAECLPQTFDGDSYKKQMALENQFWSMTRLNDCAYPLPQSATLVQIDFWISEQEGYMLLRLEKEKRFGTLTLLEQNHWLFEISVMAPVEMIPWIRSFGAHAQVRSSDAHTLAQEIAQDWKAVKQQYGIIS